MSRAHATPDLLTAYAGGSLSEGLSLLVASHMTYCPCCRGRVTRLDALGGALLQLAPEVAPSTACLEGALARIAGADGAPQTVEPRARVGSSWLPAPIQAQLGRAAEKIRWRFLLPGLSEHRLTGFESEDVRLIRARPGTRIPEHTHVGMEATLILSGTMRDGDRVLARGDLALADATEAHAPQIEGPEPCLCIVALTGPLRFTGRVGRALNRFTS